SRKIKDSPISRYLGAHPFLCQGGQSLTMTSREDGRIRTSTANCRNLAFKRPPMAFAWFGKHATPTPVAEAKAPVAAPTPEPAPSTEAESAKAILDLLELELGGMIRQLERAASSVASGADATASTLSDIRQRAEALSGRSSTARGAAATFAQAADKVTQSAQ